MKWINQYKILLFCVLCSNSLTGQADLIIPASEEIAMLQYRQFDTSALSEYRNSREFQYGTVMQYEKSLWSRIKAWFFERMIDVIGPDASLFTKILTYGLLALGIMGMVLYFSKVQTNSLLKKADRRQKLHAEILDNEMNIQNIDILIKQAVDQSDFKTAIRYQLIQLLLQLEKSGILKLEESMTIAQYRKLFPKNEFKTEFASLTSAFEFVWYGDYPLGKESYHLLESRFNTLLNSLGAKA